MTPYRKKGFPTFYMRVPVQQGGDGPVRSCCTTDADTAGEVEALVKRLQQKKRWDLLERVTAERPTLTLGQLLYADRIDKLDELLETLDDVDLTTHVEGWEAWLKSNLGNSRTIPLYRAQVASLIEDPDRAQSQLDINAGFTRIRFLSELKPAKVSKWLTTRSKANGQAVTTGYKRQTLYALFSFIAYLREMDVLSSNPIENIKRPKKGKKRIRWESEANDIKIVEATDGADKQSCTAFIKATGADVTPALMMLPRDIEIWPEDDKFFCGVGHVPGTKTEKRDRHDVLIEKWARPWLERQLRNTMPRQRIWGTITRFNLRDAHVAACKAVEIDDYTLRDSRHSWAVRARKYRKASFESIAEQLGNTVYQVAQTYAQFKQTLAERIAEGQESESSATNSATSEIPTSPAAVISIGVKR